MTMENYNEQVDMSTGLLNPDGTISFGEERQRIRKPTIIDTLQSCLEDRDRDFLKEMFIGSSVMRIFYSFRQEPVTETKPFRIAEFLDQNLATSRICLEFSSVAEHTGKAGTHYNGLFVTRARTDPYRAYPTNCCNQ